MILHEVKVFFVLIPGFKIKLPKIMTWFIFLFFVCFVGLISCTQKKEISDWRGPNRDGIYLESGLLKEWPEESVLREWCNCDWQVINWYTGETKL
jgi:hypothetical protein